MPYPRPTDQERHWLEITRPEADSYLNANEQGILYVRDIRFKMHRAVSEIQDGGLLTTTVDYLKDTYGVELTIAADGLNFLPEYKIVDEQKYLIFMMKF